MNKKTIVSRIGMRTWKSVISVGLTAALFRYVLHATPFFGCIGAVVAVGRTRRDSIENMIIRNLGTAVGGIMGMIMVFLTDNVFIEALGIIPIIYTAQSYGRSESIIPGCIVYFATVYLTDPALAHNYAFERILHTLLGSVIGFLVNILLWSPKENDPQPDDLSEGQCE